ncbi:MAG: hypothetical protein COW30_13065 [Rhodospirillales bacterium CG15_BIG_FIL_POST_REV_8_21_14_020_66_15]|nr:MAG: hypothetical protein COW30_13065 [Rhodospirillales bacterium CG15_BIG_FIL_POST_REV_8_21_14_020_66_15]
MCAQTVHIGSGAGFAGDRLDAGLPVVETLARRDGPRYLIFEVMGERTLAIAQRIKMRNPELGYSPYLEPYLRGVLKAAKDAGVRVVANLGNANPLGGAKKTLEIAKELGVKGLRVAVVLGPLIHEFGWIADDWDRLAAGTLAGHLLECGGQVTGGYFCDPGFKDVPGMDDLGFPIGEIDADGSIVITKAENTGGLVTRATVTEQILYEMHDPAAYLTPDVALDVTGVVLEDAGKDRVRVVGARGHPPPETLKVTVSADGGWLGEAELTYAGSNALARARLAADIVRTRLVRNGVTEPVRVEVVGAGAAFDNDAGDRAQGRNMPLDGEYRLRAAVRSADKATAQYVNDEVLSLFCSGPAGGGGYRCSITGQVNTASVLVPRGPVEAQARAEEVTE